MLNLPVPLQPAPWKEQLEREDRNNQKKDNDYIVGSILSGPRKNRLILVAPNGSKWSIQVSNSGIISASAA